MLYYKNVFYHTCITLSLYTHTSFDIDWITNVATEYKFHVYTADKLGAGTDAKVYIRIYGERANLPERSIDPPGDSFERDQ